MTVRTIICIFLCVYNARLLAMQSSLLVDSPESVKDVARQMNRDRVCVIRPLSSMDLPAVFMNCSRKDTSKLARLQYAATLLFYQMRLIHSAANFHNHSYAVMECEKALDSAVITKEFEQSFYKKAAKIIIMGSQAADFDLDLLLERAKSRVLLESSSPSEKFVHLVATRFARDLDLAEFNEIRLCVCENYDTEQWKSLGSSIYPLCSILRSDDLFRTLGALCGLLKMTVDFRGKITAAIDATVADIPELQPYRLSAWGPQVMISPALPTVDELVASIGPVEPAHRAGVAVGVRAKKKEKRHKPAERVAALAVVDREDEGGDVPLVEELAFDTNSAFWCSAVGSFPDSDSSAPERSSDLGHVLRMGSPVDGMARDSETVPVPARYMYDLRTLLWHRSKLDTLCDYIGEKYQKINVSQTIAQHRIPLVLENVWPNFARSEERSFHGNDYQTMLFDGALIFGDGRCYLGTYEISMPLNDANLVVHRFFKIGRGCTLHGLSSMLPERGEHERRVMCKRHVYTVYENDYAICIFENDSPINATYVVFK